MLNRLDALLAPLARFLVAQGVAFPDFAERMKLHFVKAAEASPGGKPTDSRLSVLTGLHRRDIARLRAEEIKPPPPNHLSRLVALWVTSPDLDKTLPRPAFDALAHQVRSDIHPRTLLDALIATGTVGLSEDGTTVTRLKTSYQPLPGSDEQITYLSANMGDHLAAAVDNVTGHAPPHFERAVHYSNLTAEQITELQAEFHDRQMALLEGLSERAARMKGNGQGALRFRAGGYFFQTSAKDAP